MYLLVFQGSLFCMLCLFVSQVHHKKEVFSYTSDTADAFRCHGEELATKTESCGLPQFTLCDALLSSFVPITRVPRLLCISQFSLLITQVQQELRYRTEQIISGVLSLS